MTQLQSQETRNLIVPNSMKSKFLWLSLAACFSLIPQTHGADTDRERLLANQYDEMTLPLSKWVTAGPFAFSSVKNGFDTKWQDPLRLDGSLTDENLFQVLAARSAADFSYNPIKALLSDSEINYYNLYHTEKSTTEIAPSFYAVARIDSRRNQVAYFTFGSDGDTQIWLNDQLVFQTLNRRQYASESFTDSISINLKQGANFILVKTIDVKTSCGLIAYITPTEHSLVDMLLAEDQSFLTNLIADPKHPIIFNLRGLSTFSPASLTIRNASNEVVAKATANLTSDGWRPTSQTPPGIYSAEWNWHGILEKEAFFVGNLDEYLAKLVVKLNPLKAETAGSINFKTLTERLNNLSTPTNRKLSDREWQRKIIYSISEADEAIQRCNSGLDPWKNVTGLHIRGFRSKIDGQERHYRIFIPPQYDRLHPLPLAIMIATSLSASRPFIESAFISHQIDAEMLSKIAEDGGIGILWPGYPAEPYGNLCEYSHLDDVLSDLSKNYNIDFRRISLMGTCRAGMTALMTAEHFPGRFAAIGLLDPIGTRESNYQISELKYRQYPAYTDWLEELAPLKHLKILGHLPLRIVYDGGDPDHGTLYDAKQIEWNAQKADLPAILKYSPYSLGHMAGWKDILKWLANVNPTTDRHALSPNDSSSAKSIGPIAEAFPDGFLLVVGTLGNSEEKMAIKRIADRFQKGWIKHYYGPCRMIEDTSITPEMESTANLVLIGNSHLNRIWAKLAPRLPITIKAQSLEIFGKHLTGQNLGIQAICMHPDFKDRRLILIGSDQIAYVEVGDLDLSIDGWFDYAIWKHGHLLEAKRYSEDKF